MTLAEHLAEVRHRFLVSAITVSLFGVVAFIFYPQILHVLQEPYCAARSVAHKGCTFLVTAPLDGLTLRIKIGFFGGLLLASPVLFWQLWRFITPGLKLSLIHISEPTRQAEISYAVFCLKKKKKK